MATTHFSRLLMLLMAFELLSCAAILRNSAKSSAARAVGGKAAG